MKKKIGLWSAVSFLCTMMGMPLWLEAAPFPFQCQQNSDCQPICEQEVKRLRAPSKVLTKYVASRCMELGKVTRDGKGTTKTTGCACSTDAQLKSFRFLAKSGHAKDGCLVFGREQSCLYKETEFPGCDLSAADTSCQSICKDLEQRVQANEQATFQASTHQTTCIKPGACGCSIKYNNSCYFVFGSRLEPYDCSQSHQEVWDRLNGFDKQNNTSKGMGCSVTKTTPPPASLLWMIVLFGWGLWLRRR